MGNRFRPLCNWPHGDISQYDISHPHNAKPTGQIWMTGLLGKSPHVNGVKVARGSQMILLLLLRWRLYVATRLLSI